MKEINTSKIRAAILSLQNSGKIEYASAVWDLLDNYVSQPAQPIVFHPTTTALEDALAGGFGPQNPTYVRDVLAKRDSERGASSWNGLPGCTVSAYHAAAQPCPQKAWGHLVRVGMLAGSDAGKSFPMCREHGEMFNRPGYADWVQAFFGDENNAADVAAPMHPDFVSQFFGSEEEAREDIAAVAQHVKE